MTSRKTLEVIVKLANVNIDKDPSFSLPDLGLDNIKLQRLTYQAGPADKKHVIILFTVTIAGISIQSRLGNATALTASINFAGQLLLPLVNKNSPELGSFKRYMSEVEEWNLFG